MTKKRRLDLAAAVGMLALLTACGTATVVSEGQSSVVSDPGSTAPPAQTSEGPAETVVPSSDDAPSSTTTQTSPGTVVTVPPEPEPKDRSGERSAGTPAPDEPAPGNVDPLLSPFVESAVADLSGRLSVDPSAVAVIRAEAVVWPDGSIGCPVPGMAYTQVLVDGTLVELWVDGVLYRYHSGGNRPQFLCENPAVSSSSDSGGTSGDV